MQDDEIGGGAVKNERKRSEDHRNAKRRLTPTRFSLSETKVYSFFGSSALGGGSSSTTSTKGQQHILKRLVDDRDRESICVSLLKFRRTRNQV